MKKFFNNIFPPFVRLPLILSVLASAAAYYLVPFILGEGIKRYEISVFVDKFIPLVPSFIIIYFFAYIQWIFSYIYHSRESVSLCCRFTTAAVIAKLICAVIFAVLPTAIVRPEITGNGIFDYAMRFLYTIDKPINLFPSIHCLESYLCFRTAMMMKNKNKAYIILQGITAVLVCASTVFTKQHFFIDIPAGILAGEIGIILSDKCGFWKLMDKIQPLPVKAALSKTENCCYEKNNLKQTPELKEDSAPFTNKKVWMFMILFAAIALLSILAVVAQSREFSLVEFGKFIKNASLPWLVLTLLSVFAFIFLEGLAILVLCKAFGHKRSLWQGYIYSAADIYFSAITPSATGGQPASAYFMMKDGMGGMLVTALLLCNLCMYTLSIVIIGIICLVFRSDLFLRYSTPSQLLIILGFIIQVGLFIFFYMLLKKEKMLHKICGGVLNFLCFLKILRHKERKMAKLDAYMERYRQQSMLLSGHSKAVFLCFVCNFLQRICQMAAPALVYTATTGANIFDGFQLLFLQGYVVIGANCIPIPGAIGITDYLMLDGFCNFMSKNQAVNLELLSRSFSFYSCVIICGISVLLQYLLLKKRGKNQC